MLLFHAPWNAIAGQMLPVSKRIRAITKPNDTTETIKSTAERIGAPIKEPQPGVSDQWPALYLLRARFRSPPFLRLLVGPKARDSPQCKRSESSDQQPSPIVVGQRPQYVDERGRSS